MLAVVLLGDSSTVGGECHALEGMVGAMPGSPGWCQILAIGCLIPRRTLFPKNLL